MNTFEIMFITVWLIGFVVIIRLLFRTDRSRYKSLMKRYDLINIAKIKEVGNNHKLYAFEVTYLLKGTKSDGSLFYILDTRKEATKGLGATHSYEPIQAEEANKHIVRPAA